MKREQNKGISLLNLVLTILVILIIAAIAIVIVLIKTNKNPVKQEIENKTRINLINKNI